MEHRKADIRDQIAGGNLEDAAAAALKYATDCGLPDIVNGLTGLSGRIRSNFDEWRNGVISYENFSIAQAQAIQGLTDYLDRLPDRPPKKTGRSKRMLSQQTFKNGVFYALCIIKAVVLFRLTYHWNTGGFSQEQFQATVALLAPTLAAYISVMLADYLRQAGQDPLPTRYLSGPLVTFSFWLFPIYGILLFLLIELKAKSTLSFSQMNLWLALVESVLGGYIGQIVSAFFKKE